MKIEVELDEVLNLKNEISELRIKNDDLFKKIESFDELKIQSRINKDAVELLDLYVKRICDDNNIEYTPLNSSLVIDGLDRYGKNILLFDNLKIELGYGFNEWVKRVCLQAVQYGFDINLLKEGDMLVNKKTGQIFTFYRFLESNNRYFQCKEYIDNPQHSFCIFDFSPYKNDRQIKQG